MLPSISKLKLACPPCGPPSVQQAAPTGVRIKTNAAFNSECPMCVTPIRQTFEWTKDPVILSPPVDAYYTDEDIAFGLAKDTFFNVRCGHVVHLACQAGWATAQKRSTQSGQPEGDWLWRCCFEGSALAGSEDKETIIDPDERQEILTRLSPPTVTRTQEVLDAEGYPVRDAGGVIQTQNVEVRNPEGVRDQSGEYWTQAERDRVEEIAEHLRALRAKQALEKKTGAGEDAAAVRAAAAAATAKAEAAAAEREQGLQARITEMQADIAQYKIAYEAVQENKRKEAEAANELYDVMQGQLRDDLEAAEFLAMQREGAVRKGKTEVEILQKTQYDVDADIEVLQRQLQRAQQRSSELETSLEEAKEKLSSANPPSLRREQSAPGKFLTERERKEQELRAKEQERRVKEQANEDAMLMIIRAAETLNTRMMMQQMEKIDLKLVEVDPLFQRPGDRKSVLHALFTPSKEVRSKEQFVSLANQSVIVTFAMKLFDSVPDERRNQVKQWLQNSRDGDHFTILCLASKTCAKAMCELETPNPLVLASLNNKIHEVAIRWLVTTWKISVEPYSPNDPAKKSRPKIAKKAYQYAHESHFAAEIVKLLQPAAAAAAPPAKPTLDPILGEIGVVHEYIDKATDAIVGKFDTPLAGSVSPPAPDSPPAPEAAAAASIDSKQAARARKTRAAELRAKKEEEAAYERIGLLKKVPSTPKNPLPPQKEGSGKIAQILVQESVAVGLNQRQIYEAVNGESDKDLVAKGFLDILPGLSNLIDYVMTRYTLLWPQFHVKKFIFYFWYSADFKVDPEQAVFRRFVCYLWRNELFVYPKTLDIFEADIFYRRRNMLPLRYASDQMSKDGFQLGDALQRGWLSSVLSVRKETEYLELKKATDAGISEGWDEEGTRDRMLKFWDAQIDTIEQQMVFDRKMYRKADPVLTPVEEDRVSKRWLADNEVIDTDAFSTAMYELYKSNAFFPFTSKQFNTLFRNLKKDGFAVLKSQRLAIHLEQLGQLRNRMNTLRELMSTMHTLDGIVDATGSEPVIDEDNKQALRDQYEEFGDKVELAVAVVKNLIDDHAPELASQLARDLARAHSSLIAAGGARSASSSVAPIDAEDFEIVAVSLQTSRVLYRDRYGEIQSVNESDLESFHVAEVGVFLNNQYQALVQKNGLQEATEVGEKPPAEHHVEYEHGMLCELDNANEPLHVAFRNKLESLVPAQRLSGDTKEIKKISFNGKPDLDLLPEDDFFAGNPELTGASDVQIVQYQILKALRAQSEFKAKDIDTQSVGINTWGNLIHWLQFITSGIMNRQVAIARTGKADDQTDDFWELIQMFWESQTRKVQSKYDAESDATIDEYLEEWEDIHDDYLRVAGTPKLQPNAVATLAKKSARSRQA